MKRCLFQLLFSVFYFSACFAESIDYEDWMAKLPDDMLMCDLSVPGSHDSGTKGFQSCGETQLFSISDQLTLGVRAFDLRPGITSNKLYIFHSEYLHSNETLEEIFTYFSSFLKAHPTECLFVCMKQECGDDNQWQGLVKECLDEFSDYLLPFTHELTLGEMRGKILLLSRSWYAEEPYGAYFNSSWADNATSTNCIKGSTGFELPARIQDIYDDTEGIEQKLTDLQTLMNESMVGNSHKLFINHTSGYTNIGIFNSRYLADCAQQTNKIVVDCLSDNTGPVGLIMSDFMGTDNVKYSRTTYYPLGQQLIDNIISNCYRCSEVITGISSNRKWRTQNGDYYNLSGQKVTTAQHGLYIINGRKVIK